MLPTDLNRIVSLEPSVTAILFALGQQARLAAVSEWCDRLVDVGDRPRLPSTWSAKPEDIVALSPDLVIASVPYRAEAITDLLQAKLNVLCLRPQHLADTYAHIAWLGRLTDAVEEAEQVISQMQADFEAIRRQVAGLHRPRVYVEMWPKPPMSSPDWVGELVEIAGGEFVPAKPGRAVTDDEIREADPEIIAVAWAGVTDPPLQRVIQRSGWDQVSAVLEGRVMAVDEIYLNAPGSNLVHGARLLADAIHPEVFSELAVGD
ncbi:MAG: ABC transporter substrate-binding protein [Anaerolineae bacterium]